MCLSAGIECRGPKVSAPRQFQPDHLPACPLATWLALQEAALLRGVVLRCRDRDGAVRHDAFAMLARFPQASLERHLALGDWQALLDIGLAGPLPCTTGGGGGGGIKPASKQHMSATQAAAMQLLRQYLGVGGSRGGEESATADDEDEEGGGADGHSFGSSGQEEHAQMAEGWEEEEQAAAASWALKLRALQLPPRAANDESAAAQHLQAAWQEALGQVLTQEQLQVAAAQPAAQSCTTSTAAAAGLSCLARPCHQGRDAPLRGSTV